MLKPFLFSFIAISLLSVLYFSLSAFHKNKLAYQQGKYIVYAQDSNSESSRVLGISSDRSYGDINYRQQRTNGSPLVFGGAQSPNAEDADAWQLIKNVGVTSVRKDFFLEYSLPGRMTIEDYTSNRDDLSNPKNWQTKNVNIIAKIFSEAKEHNLQNFGIVSYAPPWLTYSGDQYGVPKDWAVYRDIVKKLYVIHRKNLDYLEIWNEPSYEKFLNPKGTNLNRSQAYIEIFKNASKAIREVDSEANDGKKIMIGGPVDHTSTNFEILDAILTDQDAKRSLDFISFHHYGALPPNWQKWRTKLRQYNVENLPIFLTEWNYLSDVKISAPEVIGEKAIPYTASMLINFLNEGIAGANYYSLFPVDREFKNGGHGFLAFYEKTGNKIQLLPQSKTWSLLSNTLSLGKGTSNIYESDSSENISILGFRNSNGEYGAAVANQDAAGKQINLTFKNIPYDNFVTLSAYEASVDADGESLISTTVIPVKNNTVTYIVNAPPNSAVGIIMTGSNRVSYRLRDFIRILYSL